MGFFLKIYFAFICSISKNTSVWTSILVTRKYLLGEKNKKILGVVDPLVFGPDFENGNFSLTYYNNNLQTISKSKLTAESCRYLHTIAFTLHQDLSLKYSFDPSFTHFICFYNN